MGSSVTQRGIDFRPSFLHIVLATSAIRFSSAVTENLGTSFRTSDGSFGGLPARFLLVLFAIFENLSLAKLNMRGDNPVARWISPSSSSR